MLFVRLVNISNGGDVFELDLRTGEEAQLADVQFSTLMELRYLPDGRNFIFTGKGPAKGDVEPKFAGNFIHIMGPDYGYGLKPAFIQGKSSAIPSMSADGK